MATKTEQARVRLEKSLGKALDDFGKQIQGLAGQLASEQLTPQKRAEFLFGEEGRAAWVNFLKGPARDLDYALRKFDQVVSAEASIGIAEFVIFSDDDNWVGEKGKIENLHGPYPHLFKHLKSAGFKVKLKQLSSRSFVICCER